MKRLLTFFPALMFLFILFSFLGTTAYATSASPTAGTVTTSGTTLNVRSGPSTSKSIIGYLSRGSIVTLYEKSGGWWRLGLSGGRYGYCSSDYISEISGSVARQITAGDLNVRSGPSTSYPVKAVLSRGTVVVKLSTSGSFAKIVYDGNKTGYASAAYLGSLNTYAAVSLSVPSYKQTDSRWASVEVGGSGRTISDIGCATTALAMTESYRSGSTITPDVMENRLSYTSGGSVYWPDNYSLIDSVSYSSIYAKLKSKIPVIVGAKKADGSTHFVVVKGYVGGDSLTASGFTINDPGSSTRTTLSQFLSVYPDLFRMVYYSN